MKSGESCPGEKEWPVAIFGTRRWGCVPNQEKHIYDELIIIIMNNVRLFMARRNTFMIIVLKMILANSRSTIGAYERWVK